jgi:hypothetical protein
LPQHTATPIRSRLGTILVVLLGVIRPGGTVSAVPAPTNIVVHPADNGEALPNPGMGWVLHYYDNSLSVYGTREEPSDTLQDFPGLGVVYFRLAWNYLEPEKGKLNWSIVDGPAQRFLDRGLQVAFRFTCYEGHGQQYDATPAWVRAAGAKGVMVTERDGRDYWQPKYDDPIFLKHLNDFLAAAARRYDGNPHVAWIDVGSFGIWGEGHTKSYHLPYSHEVRRLHVDLLAKHFKHTLIAVNDDLGGGLPGRNGTLDDIVTQPGRFTLRDDSILVNPGPRAYRSAYMAERFWPREPVILESAHYLSPKQAGFWDDGAKYAEAVEAYRASYLSIHWYPREFLSENRDFIRRMNLRMGYRLNLLEAAWPAAIGLNDTFEFCTRWKNAGVAPCYPGGYVALTLKTSQGGIVAVCVDESWNVRELGVDLPGTSSKVVEYDDAGPRANGTTSLRSLRLPVPGSAPIAELRSRFTLPEVVKTGAYELFVSVGSRDGTPSLALPLKEGDGHRRYRLGTLSLGAPHTPKRE